MSRWDVQLPLVDVMRALLRGCYWGSYMLLAFLVALALAWRLLAWQQFLYPVWYPLLRIDRTIARFAPQNPYRPGFQLTSRAERERLFAAIAEAVEHNGRGLAQLRYHSLDGRVLGRLLTDPEIVHLQDVSRLLSRWRSVAAALLLTLLGWTLWLVYRRRPLPPARRLLGGLSVALLAVGSGVLLVGPVRLFYTWHSWVFPPNHPWFFYYQDSLMTTLMKAPDLFFAIGAVWLSLGWLILALLLVVAHCLTRWRGLRSG